MVEEKKGRKKCRFVLGKVWLDVPVKQPTNFHLAVTCVGLVFCLNGSSGRENWIFIEKQVRKTRLCFAEPYS